MTVQMISIISPLLVAVLNGIIAVHCFNRQNETMGWLNLVFSAANVAVLFNEIGAIL